MECKLDLTLCDSRFWLRSRDCTDDELVLGHGNRQQGLRRESGLVVLDPLADEEFGADVIVRLNTRFSADKRAQRRLQLPFTVPHDNALWLGSPAEEQEVPLTLPAGDYRLSYEICLGRDVFYILTLQAEADSPARALMNDGWGLRKDQDLPAGLF